MDGENYLRFILALLLVLGLLALAAVLLRRSGLGPKLSRSRRLAALESLAVSPRHRLLLVRRDNVEHLLLLGPQGDLVIETNIQSTPTELTAQSYGQSDPNGAASQTNSSLKQPKSQRSFAAVLEDRASPAVTTSGPRSNLTNEQD
jgi:flagellar protein FliO/FliZ